MAAIAQIRHPHC